MFRSPLIRVSFVLLLFIAFAPEIRAKDGDPLAVRNWPGGTISIETHWGLHLVINPGEAAKKALPRAADQEVTTSEKIDHYLFRKPNEEKVEWLAASEVKEKDANAIHVKSISKEDLKTNALLIEVDGVQIVYLPKPWVVAKPKIDSRPFGTVDLLILETPDDARIAQNNAIHFAGNIHPRLTVVKGKGIAKIENKDLKQAFRKHNTLALSSSDASKDRELIVLSDQPWQMPDELAKLFDAMETSCKESQEVFRKLSVEQLNFKPSNGTHTPRWNAEHMMGRELLFFSQIYHAKNGAIPVMDLNPKQMPPDYVAAHPDWTGAEEARQMQRVSDFARRFAYLFEDQDLDKKPVGSRWTPRGLLKQMDHHYDEHTENTKKKFDLPDWPM